MSQAEDLLNSLTSDDTTDGTLMTLISDVEVEEHIAIGKDRFITVPQNLKKIAVQFDNNVRTVTFDCPRYSDGRDLSTMTVSINYLRPDGVPGLYLVTEVTIDETDNSIMHFDWVIEEDVTVVSGTLSFLVCAKKTDSEGYNENHWNTELNQDMTISKGLKCDDYILKRYPDLISQILLRLDSVEEKEVTQDDIENALGYVPAKHDANLYETWEGSLINIQNTSAETAHLINVASELVGHTVTSCGKNLFNINGEVNINLSTGEERPGYVVVENGILTANLYTSGFHPNGQRLYNLKGRMISFSALCISEDVRGYIGIYEDGQEGKHVSGKGLVKIEGYVCKTDNPIFGFNTSGTDTGAKFTNIQIEIGGTATDYEPYVSDSVYVYSNTGHYQIRIHDGQTNIYNDCNANMSVIATPLLNAVKEEVNAYTDQNASALLKYIQSIVKPYELTWTDGGYISRDDGSVNAEEGSSYSNFVDVVPGSKMIITNTMETDTEYNVFYDFGEHFVSSFSTDNGSVVTVPDGARKFRLSKRTVDEVIILPEIVIEKPKATTIDLPISGWTGSNLLYQQTVSVPIVTANSQVDLRPSPSQLEELLTTEISLTAANEAGSVTVFAIGGKPISDYTMQIIVSEVDVV